MTPYQSWGTGELSRQPQKWLLEVVIGFSGDVVVLKILLAVESDSLGFHLALLHIDFVSTENDWDLLTNTDEVT